MFQRDYLMRMIHQMSVAMGQIMGLRQQKENKEALLLVDELLERNFRMNSMLLQSLSGEDIVRLMSRNGQTDYAGLQSIALLLREKAAIHEEEGETGLAFGLRVKALHLLLRSALDRSGTIVVDPEQGARELERHLTAYELPVSLNRLLMDWYEASGRLDEAENMLHELLEDGELEFEEAEQFYVRMEKLGNERLLAGGLSIEEVTEASELLHAQWNKQGV
ncbi:DUF6483 family protein [Paenibacillus sp. GCM10012307]|uniref:Uncharacterized protein n=2 Tax=Paenibacillus TaxID=44249 RepID=A0A934MKR0_9BACL|nr:DUF6483 family protein [Paenibacillus roseus]MBJ6361330.1 hypothetical protein [Paenibacillus roseus]